MLAGLAAGLLAFAFAYVFGEPQVQKAIDFESYLARIHHEPQGPELVSRGLQRTAGLLTGTVGALFSLAFAWAYGRIGALSPRVTALVLAAAAYVTVILVPFTKYPANPPTIRNPDTIGRRTLLYFLMIAVSLLAALAAGRVRRAALPRVGAWNAGLVAAGAFLALVGVAELLLPAVHETPAGFPADVLYRFRLASLRTDLTLWAALGLGFGAAAQRLLVPDGGRAGRARGAVRAQ